MSAGVSIKLLVTSNGPAVALKQQTAVVIVLFILTGCNVCALYYVLYVCMYVCMYVCIYVCMHVCVYVCVYVCIY